MDLKSKLKLGSFIKDKPSSSCPSSPTPSPSHNNRSFYRQPLSQHRPRSSSCSLTQVRWGKARGYSVEHDDSELDTRGSHAQKNKTGKLQYSRSADDEYRPRASSTGSHSILKRDHLLRKLAALKLRSKHASFCESVDVLYYDDNENCLSSTSSESSVCKLNDMT